MAVGGAGLCKRAPARILRAAIIGVMSEARSAPVAPPSDPLPAAACPVPCWDVFCRVIDHRGDAGVAWRLARNLALRAQRVRLWIDLPQALVGMDDEADRAWVASGRIAVHPWSLAETAPPDDAVVVVEAFGCTLPDAVQATMRRRADSGEHGGAPFWVDLEYLSAEPWVERSHRLPSPRLSGPAAGLVTWFFFPGFTPATGGLLREPGIAESALPPAERPAPGDLVVSRFDYDPPGADDWLRAWAGARPAGRLVCRRSVGVTRRTEASAPPSTRQPAPEAETGRLVIEPLPWLTQSAYDALLSRCDLNIVRGEDSFVRAQWAGRPLLWHIYAQPDGAHAAKLEAWLDRYLECAPAALAAAVRQAHRAWNGLAGETSPADALAAATDPAAGWAQHALAWRSRLRAQADLATQLIAFAAEHGAPVVLSTTGEGVQRGRGP
jgi:uncharacterized repeat protein (TIGR03837 family)